MTRCRPHSRQPSQSPIRCGHDPAGLRSALCRESVRNGYALSRCVAPRCRKPTHEPPDLCFKLQTLPICDEEDRATGGPGNVAGFSLHAGVAVKASQRDKLERLCRYICRPPVSEKRLFLTARGEIGYTLKTPYRDGTTHFIFEPLDFIARLAALVPPPRLNLTRFHGVFAPNSPYRARITPARRGRGGKPRRPQPLEDRTPAEQRSAMRWAKRLKRVFRIDVETCPKCGGTVQIIASIEDPPVIERILNHLAKNDLPGLWPDSRAPPGTGRPAERPGLHH